jgi:type I restriction-modification system DNA methylase subunit
MTTHAQQVVQKLWSYCNVLRDDGMSYGDYLEQLTYLLFLKMAHEREQYLPTGIFYANGVKANVLFFDEHSECSAQWQLLIVNGPALIVVPD